MTSAASQTNQNPASTTTAPAAVPSYASAAGANKKPTSTPLIATGSHPPPVIASSAAANGKPSAASSVNGRPNAPPVALPVATPAVVRSSAVVNGSGVDHTRKSSVTINAPNSMANGGGPMSGQIKFGFESPAIAHSSPQVAGAVPIPIPGGGNQRVVSPAQSPSPIPQIPQQSGGQRAPSNAQVPVAFGSFPGEGDRHMKQHNLPVIGHNPHVRRDSQVSAHGEHGGPGHGRSGFQGQGRGRGSFGQHFNNPNAGFPPTNRNFSGPGAGRGVPFNRGVPSYQGSPRQTAASPAGTPNMGHATPIPQQPGYYPHQPMYPHQMNASYMPPIDGFRPTAYPGQYMAPMNYMQPAPPYGAPQAAYVPQYGQGQPVAQPMSRNASQVSDHPASSAGPAPVPAIVQGTTQPRPTGAAPVVVSSSFRPPAKKSAAIVIRDAQGNPIDFKSVKGPASPAPSIQQSKTPPVIASTPTPPPKPSTPSHARNESTTSKTSEQIRLEFIAQVAKSVPSDGKAKADEAAKEAADKAAADAAAAEKAAAEKAAADKAAAEEKEAAEKVAAEKAAAEKEAAEKAAAEKAAAEKAAAEKEAAEKAAAEKAAAEKAAAEKAAAEKAAAEKAAEEKAAADRAAEEAKAKAEAESKAKAEAEAKPAQETEEEELERMIREMEEEDRRREEEQAKITAKKEAEKAEAKKRADAEKLDSASNDRKLKEAEAEMERLEEERERKRNAEKAGASAESDATSLTKKISELKIADATAAAKSSSADKPRGKPAALNLAPLKTTPVEAPQPSAALQSLRSARFLPGVEYNIYPEGIRSPNPSLNSAVHKKGKVFKYDAQFLLQFQQVFTEQPSMEFHQQVKTLIGDSDGPRSAARTPGGAGSGRQNSRAGSSSAFPSGGAMGQFGSKPLPPGTTSEQRFAMAQAGMTGPRVGGMGGMGGFNRPGGFPGNTMSRNPSSAGGPGGLPSPRTGSRRGAGSKRGDNFNPKAEAQAAKTMPLTAGMELKPITISSTGWKPTSIGNKAAQNPTAVVGQAGHLDPAMVQRKVKAALNKMTPENFDKIADQILAIAAQSKDEQDGRTLRQVIQLTFEKATDEAHWASMYAKFCKRMLETMSADIRDENILDKAGNVVSGGPLFRKYLLNRCQTEFERGWKVDLPPAPEAKDEDKKTPGEVMLSDEYYILAAAKRRGLGLVQFIGELYKLGMLTERIMHECVRKLLEYEELPDEAEIESLSKLLRTIGGNLDSTEKGHSMMNAYFQRVMQMVEIPSLNSRLKFMLMDIVDLRKAGWHSKEANKGPKTLDEVRAEAEAAAAQKAADNARSNTRGPPGGRPMGRQDSRNFSYSNAPPNTVTNDDLRRLKSRGNSSQPMNSFGPTSMFNSRSNSGRRLGGPGGAFGRAGEDSGASSRTGTPPVAHANAFGLLADTGDHPGSPPSAAASPALPKATLDTVASGDDKKD